MKSRAVLLLVALLGAALVWLGVFWQPAGEEKPRAIGSPAAHKQLQLAPVPQGGDFVLRSATGSLALQQFRGKVVLLYFGYTFCPDVCPTSLALIAQALSALTADELARVQVIFVSIDPQRDTLARLKEYASFFHPKIVGASGSPQEVAAVARLYGASFSKQAPNADGNYTVDHSSFTYLIDTDGRFIDSLPHASSPQKIVERIRLLLKPAR